MLYNVAQRTMLFTIVSTMLFTIVSTMLFSIDKATTVALKQEDTGENDNDRTSLFVILLSLLLNLVNKL